MYLRSSLRPAVMNFYISYKYEVYLSILVLLFNPLYSTMYICNIPPRGTWYIPATSTCVLLYIILCTRTSYSPLSRTVHRYVRTRMCACAWVWFLKVLSRGHRIPLVVYVVLCTKNCNTVWKRIRLCVLYTSMYYWREEEQAHTHTHTHAQ